MHDKEAISIGLNYHELFWSCGTDSGRTYYSVYCNSYAVLEKEAIVDTTLWNAAKAFDAV